MTPNVKAKVSATPKLNLYRVRPAIPLIVQMNRTVSIVNLFSLSQIYNSKVIGKFRRIFVELQPKPKNIVKALFESAPGSENLLMFPKDRVITLETGAYQVFLHKGFDIRLSVLSYILQNYFYWCSGQVYLL
jgi:hypothetical protein